MSNNVLMSLSAAGSQPIRFAVGSAGFDKLTRTLSMRWARQPRLGQRPALQALGAGEETIEIQGVVYPHWRGGFGQIQALRTAMMDQRPRNLSDGRGNAWGVYVIEKLEEQRTVLDVDGTPLRQGFTLFLAHYGGSDANG